MLFFLFILFSISSFVISDVSDFKCRTKDIDNEFAIGDEVTLCLHSYFNKKKIAYKLKVDEYSIITMKEGFKAFVKDEENPESSTIPERSEITESATTSPKEEENKEVLLRRIKYEPNPEKEEKFQDNEGVTSTIDGEVISTIDKNSIFTQNPEENPTTNTNSDIPSTEEIYEDEPGDKTKFVAQIGDKITKYPTVINNDYIIYFYFLKYSYIIELQTM